MISLENHHQSAETPEPWEFFGAMSSSELNEILSTSTLTGIPYQGTFEDFPNFQRWDFQMTNEFDGRIQSLPRVAVRGAPPSVASRPSATGCNGRRRSEDGGFCEMTKCVVFFFLPQKRIWADGFFEGCHTAMLPCFVLLFSSFFWVLVLHFGTWKSCSMGATWGTRDAHRCLQCSTGRGILESEFLWKDHRGRDFWCFGAKVSLGWFQRLLITYTSGKWLPKDRLQYNFCGGLSWTTSNTPNPEFAWHPQNSLCFNAFLPHWLQQKGRSIRRRSHISWPHHGCLYPGFVHAAPTAKGADGWIAPRTEIVIVAVVAICFCRYCCCCYLFSVFSFLLLLLL